MKLSQEDFDKLSPDGQKAYMALEGQVKEKNPTRVELGTYGDKGKAAIQVSSKGVIQFTGTRKMYGGLYLFPSEVELIIREANVITPWIKEHRSAFKGKAVVESANQPAK